MRVVGDTREISLIIGKYCPAFEGSAIAGRGAGHMSSGAEAGGPSVTAAPASRAVHRKGEPYSFQKRDVHGEPQKAS